MMGSASKILVVEDDEDMRQTVADSLARDGYDVMQADSAEQAIRVLEDLSLHNWSTKTVDLVLTDVCMAGRDGMKLVDMIRVAHWPISVIMMTAFPDAEMSAKATLLQAELLEKPFRLDLLRRMVLCTLAAALKARKSAMLA